ncbi:hypothetical protein Franean1_4028 [Parafrankia sp. EAN1pec]|uniref:hypothetical protein n=1 Tax=Parafrankia sp. (strain EAN1pec) TaxID=298653 RepID=UPI0000544E30|nr:hypothetical protein Franean1_4028 [Frankia sp. EAN1pec]
MHALDGVRIYATRDGWRRKLDAAGVPAEVSAGTHDGETLLFDDEMVRLGLVTEYEHPPGRRRRRGLARRRLPLRRPVQPPSDRRRA